jgi:hypothetical protein
MVVTICRYVEAQTEGLEHFVTDLINFSVEVTNYSLKLQLKCRSNDCSSGCSEIKIAFAST